MRTPLIVAAVICLAVGCATAPPTTPIRIYNVESGDVLSGHFRNTGRQGTVVARLKDVSCSGDYFTQDNRTHGSTVNWGTIYGWGSRNFSAYSSSSQTVQPASMLGTAVLSCEDRTVIQCEFTVNGSGFCKDNQQGKYQFMF